LDKLTKLDIVLGFITGAPNYTAVRYLSDAAGKHDMHLCI